MIFQQYKEQLYDRLVKRTNGLANPFACAAFRVAPACSAYSSMYIILPMQNNSFSYTIASQSLCGIHALSGCGGKRQAISTNGFIDLLEGVLDR